MLCTPQRIEKGCTHFDSSRGAMEGGALHAPHASRRCSASPSFSSSRICYAHRMRWKGVPCTHPMLRTSLRDSAHPLWGLAHASAPGCEALHICYAHRTGDEVRSNRHPFGILLTTCILLSGLHTSKHLLPCLAFAPLWTARRRRGLYNFE